MADKVILWTTTDTAKFLKVKTTEKVCLLVRSKLISGFKFGNKYLIDKESVVRYAMSKLGYVTPFHNNDCDINSDTILKTRTMVQVSGVCIDTQLNNKHHNMLCYFTL